MPPLRLTWLRTKVMRIGQALVKFSGFAGFEHQRDHAFPDAWHERVGHPGAGPEPDRLAARPGAMRRPSLAEENALDLLVGAECRGAIATRHGGRPAQIDVV